MDGISSLFFVARLCAQVWCIWIKSDRINDLPATKASTQTYMHLKACLESFVHIEQSAFFLFLFCHIFRYLSLHFLLLCLRWRWKKRRWRRQWRQPRQKTRHIKILFTGKHWNEEEKNVYQVEPLTSWICSRIRLQSSFTGT